MREQTDRSYMNCVIIGDEKVGKTSISESFARNSFSRKHEATVFDNYVVPLTVAGEQFYISMFDISSKCEYESLRSFAYTQSEVLVLCFSTVQRETFTNIKKLWMPELKRHSKSSSKQSKRPVILVGTQMDLRTEDKKRVGNSEVRTEEGVQLAKDIGADCYVECSARHHLGLQDVFQHVVYSTLKYRKKKRTLKQMLQRVLPRTNRRHSV